MTKKNKRLGTPQLDLIKMASRRLDTQPHQDRATQIYLSGILRFLAQSIEGRKAKTDSVMQSVREKKARKAKVPTEVRNSLIESFIMEAREAGVSRKWYVNDKLIGLGLDTVEIDVIKKISARIKRSSRSRTREKRDAKKDLKMNHARLVADARRALNGAD